MLHTLNKLVAPAAMQRLTLLLNHVLASEPVAAERLRPHAGRRLELQLLRWPSLLPQLPALVFAITPAGLLEWRGEEGGPAADLTLRMDASNPALLLTQTLGGVQPTVDIEGDAALAGEVNWLMQNLRWDLAADLERVFGPAVAAALVSVGGALAAALRTAVQGAGQLRDRWRGRS